MKTAMNFLLGLILGSLIGALLAILFAPSSGQELIGKIRSETERIRLDVTQAAQERRAELEQQLEVLRSPRKPTDV